MQFHIVFQKYKNYFINMLSKLYFINFRIYYPRQIFYKYIYWDSSLYISSHIWFGVTHRWQPTRLPCPWDSPGKNTGVGCHFLLQYMKVESESEVAQSCPTFSNPMDCSLPGSSIHGIFQARVLEWVAIAFSTFTARWADSRPGQGTKIL